MPKIKFQIDLFGMNVERVIAEQNEQSLESLYLSIFFK